MTGKTAPASASTPGTLPEIPARCALMPLIYDPTASYADIIYFFSF
jgi:hypothetical protein